MKLEKNNKSCCTKLCSNSLNNYYIILQGEFQNEKSSKIIVCTAIFAMLGGIITSFAGEFVTFEARQYSAIRNNSWVILRPGLLRMRTMKEEKLIMILAH